MDRGVLEILSVAYSFESINGWNGIYNNAQILYKKFISYARKMKISLLINIYGYKLIMKK